MYLYKKKKKKKTGKEKERIELLSCYIVFTISVFRKGKS